MTRYSNEGEKQAALIRLRSEQPDGERWCVEAEAEMYDGSRTVGVACTRTELPGVCQMFAGDWCEFTVTQDHDQD
jgi:hypothetical protein